MYLLLWSDINFEKREITINKAVSYDFNGDLTISSTKKADYRVLIIDNNTLTILKEWRKLQTDIYGSLSEDALVFPNTHSNICNPSAAYDWCDQIQEKYNLKKVSPHGLRRTHATLYYTSGASHFEIKKRMGHSFKDITFDIYVIEMDQNKIHAFEKYIQYMKY